MENATFSFTLLPNKGRTINHCGGGVSGMDFALTFFPRLRGTCFLFLSNKALAFFFLGNKALAFFSAATRHLLFFSLKNLDTKHPLPWWLMGFFSMAIRHMLFFLSNKALAFFSSATRHLLFFSSGQLHFRFYLDYARRPPTMINGSSLMRNFDSFPTRRISCFGNILFMMKVSWKDKIWVNLAKYTLNWKFCRYSLKSGQNNTSQSLIW